ACGKCARSIHIGAMSKRTLRIPKDAVDVYALALAQAKNAIGKDCACCILISCTEPGPDGQMRVEMHFEGDETLAAFLVQNAGQILEERFERQSKHLSE